jgi:AcrR family transcriptional regulator
MSSADRREAIVRATLPLLATHGANITTRQIAQAAGIAEGTVFRVFADKDELLRACVTEAFRTDDVCARVREVPADLSLAERLTAAGELFEEHFARFTSLMRTLATTGYEFRRNDRRQDEDPPRFMADLADAVADVLRRDEHRLRLPITDLARRYLGLLISIRFDVDERQDRKATLAQCTDLLLNGALRSRPTEGTS